ncbi:MAG: complex I subunit 5 family protein [Caldisericaceae bacterium]
MVNLNDLTLLVASPLFFAFLATVFSGFYKKAVKFFPLLAFLVNAFVLYMNGSAVINNPGIVISKTAGLNPPLSINMAMDKLSFLIAVIATTLGLIVSVYNIFYIKGERDSKFYSLFILLIGGITWISITGDLFNLFVAFEVTSIAAFGLVGFERDKDAAEAGFKYLVLGILAGMLLLIGIVLLYAATGTLNMADIATKIAAFTFLQKLVPFTFIFLGLAVEGALFPLNAWLPDAHPAAPSGVSAILSGIMTTASIYGIIRVTVTIFNFYAIVPFLSVFAVLTLFFGEVSAFFQKDIKRMLAYSTIGQTGLIFLAFSIGSEGAIGASFAQIINHSISKSMLFLIAGAFILQTNSREIESLKGLGYKMKVLSALFVVGALSLIGLPPFFGFESKLNVLLSIVYNMNFINVFYLVLVVSMSLVEAAYFFRVIKTLYTRDERENTFVENKGLLLPIIALALILIIVSIFPQQTLSFTKSIASQLVNRGYYLEAVLGGGIR